MDQLFHFDTSSTAVMLTNSSALAVSKVNGNPFNCSIQLQNMYQDISQLSLETVELPAGFYNIRSPFNTFKLDSTTYPLIEGNYSVDTLISNLNALSSNTFAIQFPTNQIQITGSATTVSAPPNSLLNLLGFTDGQLFSAGNVTATNSFIFPFDRYVSIWIENIGPSSEEPQKITYKVPLNYAVKYDTTVYWTRNSVNDQIIFNQNRQFPLRRLNINVYDQFGNQLDNHGVDWSFSIRIRKPI